ncbi:MAG: ABC transporter ATP-binding protein [Proteobacteria bacterium]|nr:ABC transporter ATP-binding protein [Pseudomonadota bacterium]
MNALKATDLVKSYRKVDAVKGISFEVRSGEIFALVGPNGAGKSTTLKMIATILEPTSGGIEVLGFDARKDPERVREILSYLPEEAGAYKNLTGREYLEFMSALFFESLAPRREAVDFAAEITGLRDRLEDKVKTYSKGMTRKLLLGRALMTRPRLAILDEPTSGLDVVNALEIRKTLMNMTAEGMAILLSSHNMLEIEYLADRAAILNKGMILEHGDVGEIKARHGAANLEEVFARIVQ